MPQQTHIIIGMSGGVDSSVSAKLLLDQGYRVSAVFMKNWEESDDLAYCSAQQDLEDALQVCETLEIPLHQINFSQQYWQRVFSYFLEEYRAGRTPNPDIMCNKEIKFKAFLDYALKIGADKIATGHYAGIEYKQNHYRLLQAHDKNKDQSYFLYILDQHALSKSVFPLAMVDKQAVRDTALQAGFDNHGKKDSTGICFIGERRFRDFLSQYLPAMPGDIVTLDGEIIGRHQGALYYTIGQREGLGIGGHRDHAEEAWYVAAKDVKLNRLIAVQGHQHPALLKTNLIATQLHWIAGHADVFPLHCQAKIRYRQAQQPCIVHRNDGQRVRVEFVMAQRAITEGQSIVFYNNAVCLGGGIIESAV